MAKKALISELTWRSLDYQKSAMPGLPYFVGPREIPMMLRQTRRTVTDEILVCSLGCIADNEKDLVAFVVLLKARKAFLRSVEDGGLIALNTKSVIAAWRKARKTGAAKVGGRRSADKREAESLAACDLIRDRWPLPNKEWKTPALLKEAAISYNTAIKFLGKRPIVQYNYQAKLKRQKLRAA